MVSTCTIINRYTTGTTHSSDRVIESSGDATAEAEARDGRTAGSSGLLADPVEARDAATRVSRGRQYIGRCSTNMSETLPEL